MQVFSIYGDEQGFPVVYFHGTPGSDLETEFLSDVAKAHGLKLHVIDRNAIPSEVHGEIYLAELSDAILRLGSHIPLIGFSIGASLVLKISAKLGHRSGPLFLISAAGPLDVPGAFDGMGAGQAVFKLAQKSPLVFSLASRVQALMTIVAPEKMLDLLFKDAASEDQDFAKDATCQDRLKRLFREGFCRWAGGYRRDVRNYVQPWASLLGKVRAHVTLWHGTADNWAPPSMADTVAGGLHNVSGIHWVEGAGHYSCLTRSAEDVCQAIRVLSDKNPVAA